MSDLGTLRQVLEEYPSHYSPSEMESPGSHGGFSGARLWRLTSGAGVVCLRRWPREHPSRPRLEWIHTVLAHVARQGLELVAAPILTRRGASFVEREGQLWQLEPWLPGLNDFRKHPSSRRIASALRALARVHQAARSAEPDRKGMTPCPGIEDRLRFCGRLQRGKLERLTDAVKRAGPEPLGERPFRLLEHYRRRSRRLADHLDGAAGIAVACQPCLRDVWHEHVLFQQEDVRGIVDYGAMRVDCVAVDISRLLGSMARNDADGWRIGLESYQQIERLPDSVKRLLPILHESTVLLAGINWLQWIYLEQRDFADWARVVARIDEIIEDLDTLPSFSGSSM